MRPPPEVAEPREVLAVPDSLPCPRFLIFPTDVEAPPVADRVARPDSRPAWPTPGVAAPGPVANRLPVQVPLMVQVTVETAARAGKPDQERQRAPVVPRRKGMPGAGPLRVLEPDREAPRQ
ncbi:MAG: hypothetical protein ACQETO_13155 [Pseudomonadota bacterium]